MTQQRCSSSGGEGGLGHGLHAPQQYSRVAVVKVQAGWWQVCKSLIKMVKRLVKGAKECWLLPSNTGAAHEEQK